MKTKLMSDEAKQRREAYYEWVSRIETPVVSQVSFGRSGRHWFAALIHDICDVHVHGPEGWEVEYPFKLRYIHDHRGLLEYAKNLKTVLLVRDPRDALLSEMYHHVYLWHLYETMEECVRNFQPGALKLDMKLTWWASFFEKFLPHDTIVVQYEHICLYPVETIQRVCDFVGFEIKRDPLEVIRSTDSVVRNKTEVLAYTRNREKVCFATGEERYASQCLKWQKDDLLPEGTLEYIWDNLSHIMLDWGYSETGHTTNLRRGHYV